jgi:hypothetical protein
MQTFCSNKLQINQVITLLGTIFAEREREREREAHTSKQKHTDILSII